jgi:hypothetical protein
MQQQWIILTIRPRKFIILKYIVVYLFFVLQSHLFLIANMAFTRITFTFYKAYLFHYGLFYLRIV